MSGRRARRARRRVASEPALTLIHTSNCSNPHGCLLSGEFEGRAATVRYGLEWGVSPAVIEAAFCLAVALSRGGYAKST